MTVHTLKKLKIENIVIKMENLPTIFNDFWNFIIPSIIEIVILLGLLYSFSNIKSFKYRLFRVVVKIRKNHPVLIEKILKPLGIKSLVSITCIIIVLVSIVSLHRITHSIGRNIPGNLSYFTDNTLLAYSSHRYLAEIWNLYPEIEDLHSLTMLIEKVLYENWNDFSELTTRISSIEKKQGSILINREFLKFLFIFVAFIPFILKKLKINTSKKVTKYFISYVVLLLLIANNFYNQREIIKSLNFNKTYIVRTILSEKIGSKTKDNLNVYENKLRELQEKERKLHEYFIFLIR